MLKQFLVEAAAKILAGYTLLFAAAFLYLEYASKCSNLILVDTVDQDEVVKACRKRKASVIPVSFDIDQPTKVHTTLKTIDLEHKVDLVIVCKYEDWFSHATPTSQSDDFSLSNTGESLLIRNSQSLQELLRPITDGMTSRGRGRLVFAVSASSQAFGVSGSIEYAAAHASLATFARELQVKLGGSSVSLITLSGIQTETSDEMGIKGSVEFSLVSKFCKEVVDADVRFAALPFLPSFLFSFAGNLLSAGRAKLSTFFAKDLRKIRLSQIYNQLCA